jgi:hypothetical protein
MERGHFDGTHVAHAQAPLKEEHPMHSASMSHLKPIALRAIAVVLMFVGALLAIRAFRHRELVRWPEDLVVIGAIVTTIAIGGLVRLRRRTPH